LEREIPRLTTEGEVPGLEIALVRGGKVYWGKSFGVKNAETGGAVTDETIFEAASLSKPARFWILDFGFWIEPILAERSPTECLHLQALPVYLRKGFPFPSGVERWRLCRRGRMSRVGRGAVGKAEHSANRAAKQRGV
jgi:hypothetical protein